MSEQFNQESKFPTIEKTCDDYYARKSFTKRLRNESNIQQIITDLIKTNQEILAEQNKKIIGMDKNPNSHIYDRMTGKTIPNPEFEEVDLVRYILDSLATLDRINSIINYLQYPEYVYHLPEAEADITNYLITRYC